jgi:hypothetical protein
MKIDLFPKKFTLKNDWVDGGDYDKSIGLIHKGLLAFVLLTVLFTTVFSNGATVREVIGFIVLTAACWWCAGFSKVYFVEGEKTMVNTWIWLGGLLAGATIMFA